jgi:hypothetical protein
MRRSMPGAIAEIVGAKSFQLAIGEPLIAVIIAGLNFCLRSRTIGLGLVKYCAIDLRHAKAIGKRSRRALPKFESYGMLETTAFGGWKAKEAIEWLHGIGRLVIAIRRAGSLARFEQWRPCHSYRKTIGAFAVSFVPVRRGPCGPCASAAAIRAVPRRMCGP